MVVRSHWQPSEGEEGEGGEPAMRRGDMATGVKFSITLLSPRINVYQSSNMASIQVHILCVLSATSMINDVHMDVR